MKEDDNIEQEEDMFFEPKKEGLDLIIDDTKKAVEAATKDTDYPPEVIEFIFSHHNPIVATLNQRVIDLEKSLSTLNDMRDKWNELVGERDRAWDRIKKLEAECNALLGIFSDYENPCTSLKQARIVWNELTRQRDTAMNLMSTKEAEQRIAELEASLAVAQQQVSELKPLRLMKILQKARDILHEEEIAKRKAEFVKKGSLES